MWHQGGFEEAGFDAAFAFEDLIFVAGDHFDGTVVGGDEFVVAPYLYPIWTVDVVDAYVAFGATNDATTVVETEGTRLEVGHLAVGICEGDTFLHVHACGTEDAIADLTNDFGAEVHAGEVERIDTYVEEGSSGEFGEEDALLVLHIVAEAGLEDLWLTDDAAVHNLLDLVREGHIAGPDGFGDEDAFFASEVDEFAGFGGIGGEGFLDEAGFAVLEGEAGVSVVMGMGRGDVHEIDVGIVDEGFVGVIDTGAAVALGEGLSFFEGAGGDGIDLVTRDRGDGLTHLIGDPTGADDA